MSKHTKCHTIHCWRIKLWMCANWVSLNFQAKNFSAKETESFLKQSVVYVVCTTNVLKLVTVVESMWPIRQRQNLAVIQKSWIKSLPGRVDCQNALMQVQPPLCLSEEERIARKNSLHYYMIVDANAPSSTCAVWFLQKRCPPVITMDGAAAWVHYMIDEPQFFITRLLLDAFYFVSRAEKLAVCPFLCKNEKLDFGWKSWVGGPPFNLCLGPPNVLIRLWS